MKTSPDIYNEDYFKYGTLTGKSGYSHYKWLPERTRKEIRALIWYLGIEPGQTVLDFGCAMGYWVKALREYNIKAYGMDISEYALQNADPAVVDYLSDAWREADYIVSRNTLEHLNDEDLENTLKIFHEMADTVFFSVPLCEVNGGKYIIPVAELDVTHKIRWTKEKWFSFCQECGWDNISLTFVIKGIHDKWGQFEQGTGFFTLKK